MKNNKTTKKLGAVIMVTILSTASFCCTDYVEPKLTLKDIKSELTCKEERKVAKQITVKNEGIFFKEEFVPKNKTNDFRVLTVRLTVYWAKGGDTDGDSARKRSSTGYTLKQGESIAVDPKIIPYTREVIIPNVGLVKAVDTGTAVICKRASSGKLPVIDVFFENKKDAIQFANNNPKIVKVAVIN
jgi:3D (Asp-Asp-Asp) domain-containing protein